MKDAIETLESISDEIDDVYISDSLYNELKLSTPSVTLWFYDKVLNVTSTLEYNTEYKDKGFVYKVCDIYDIDLLKDIFKSLNEASSSNVKIKNLLGIFSRANVIE